MFKKLFFLFLMALLISPVTAQDAAQVRDGFYVIEDFSGMMKSHVSPFLLTDKDAVQAINVRPNELYGAIVKRSPMFLSNTVPTAPVKSLFRHYKSDDTKYTIATYATNVSYIDGSGAETVLYANGTDGKRWSFLTYKDLLIGMNGANSAKKWDGKVLTTANTDGARTAGDVMADLGAPFAELNTGSNLDASSWYQYKVAFYDGSTYSYSDARSNPILTGSTVRDITLTDIPLGPSGTTHRYIYRTVGDASRAAVIADTSFYRVATLADNSTRTFNDTVTDATILGDTAPTWGTVSAGIDVTVPKARFALINSERLFIANDPSGIESGKSSIYWSDILNPDYFNPFVDYDLIRPDDGDEITFIKNVLGILTVGKTRTISKFYTSAGDPDTWSISDSFANIGCVAPYTAINVKAGVFFLGRDGIYAFNGQTVQLVSYVVTDKTNDILATNINEAVATVHNNQYFLSYTSAESGSAVNNRVLIYDVERDAYYMDLLSIDSFAPFDSGDDFGTLYSGSSLSDGNIYAHKLDFSRLTYRYKSAIQAGTADSVYIGGSEEAPYISLGDNSTWADETDTWEDSGDATWMVEDLTGYWYSPIFQIKATALDKIYWNEFLATTGDVTFAVRTGADSAAVEAASWSSEYTTPGGSDISALTADEYVQFRATLTSDLYIETPSIYSGDSFVIKMTYKKEGTVGESSMLSVYEQGWLSLRSSEFPKRIKEIQVFYEGTAGILNVEFRNTDGDVYDFDIDLSVSPSASSTDSYFGNETEKVYVHIPPFTDNPIGRQWSFKFSDEGTTPWTIKKVFIRHDVNLYTTFK